MKTKQDKDVIDRTDVAYPENKTEFLWLIRPGGTCDENKIGHPN